MSAAGDTLAALQEYRAVLDKHNVLRMAAVATAAVRDAGNAQQIVAAATAILGCPLQVLSGGNWLH
jgi:exopolyphosphatase/pppGpp-phosphohydrolase